MRPALDLPALRFSFTLDSAATTCNLPVVDRAMALVLLENRLSHALLTASWAESGVREVLRGLLTLAADWHRYGHDQIVPPE